MTEQTFGDLLEQAGITDPDEQLDKFGTILLAASENPEVSPERRELFRQAFVEIEKRGDQIRFFELLRELGFPV